MGGIAQGVAAKRANDSTSKANDALTARMEESRRAYAGYRPQVAAGKQQALSNTLGLFDPANAMMGEMTGGKYKMDFEPIKSQSPLVMQAAPNAFGSGDANQLGQSPYATGTLRHADQVRAAGYDAGPLDAQYQAQGGDASARREQELWDTKNAEKRAEAASPRGRTGLSFLPGGKK